MLSFLHKIVAKTCLVSQYYARDSCCYICKRQFCGFTGWAFCPLEGGGGQISWHQSYKDDHIEADPLAYMPRGLVHITGSERRLHSYPGSPHHRRFLRFAFEGVEYQYKVLPFGLSLAPCTFMQCMDTALSPLRQMGIRILNYLDDWLILAQSESGSTSHKTLLLSHLCCLGLRVNVAKRILSPSQRVSFLGTVIDSVQMTATVSVE